MISNFTQKYPHSHRFLCTGKVYLKTWCFSRIWPEGHYCPNLAGSPRVLCVQLERGGRSVTDNLKPCVPYSSSWTQGRQVLCTSFELGFYGYRNSSLWENKAQISCCLMYTMLQLKTWSKNSSRSVQFSSVLFCSKTQKLTHARKVIYKWATQTVSLLLELLLWSSISQLCFWIWISPSLTVSPQSREYKRAAHLIRTT